MATAEEYQRNIEALDWDGLAALWHAIEQKDTPGWDPGKAFEYLILRAFQLDGAVVKWPYQVQLLNLELEQIDGAIYFQHISALVESKDWAGDVAIGPIAKLRNQLLRRPAGTLGLMFSRRGFTEPARFLSLFALPQPILLWNGAEIGYCIQRRQICDMLELKYRVCVEEGLPYYDIREQDTP